MGDWVRTRESHQDVKGPTGPRGRLAERSEVRVGPSPTTGARGGDRGFGGRFYRGGETERGRRARSPAKRQEVSRERPS